MIRRLILGVLAFSVLGLATAASAAAGPEAPTGPTPERSRTGHPGDSIWPEECFNCDVLVDPCEFQQLCPPLPPPGGYGPLGIGPHSTVIHAIPPLFFPSGPLACARSRFPGPSTCTSAGLVPPGVGPGGLGPSPTGPLAPGPGPVIPVGPAPGPVPGMR